MLKRDMKIGDLLSLYVDAESCDREIFSEQRTNVLLVDGEHYASKRGGAGVMGKLRGKTQTTDDQKIRIAKNFTYKVSNQYQATILSMAPGIQASPANPDELTDQKAAELHNKVMKYLKRKYNMKARFQEFVGSFVNIGEVFCKTFFDPTAGKLTGYEPLPQEFDDTGAPITTEPKPDLEKPVMSGGFIFEECYGYDVLRDPGSKRMEDSPYLMLRKMVKSNNMKEKYKGDPEKQKLFETSTNKTYVVFDATRYQYARAKDEVMILEMYIRPCYIFPEGYYFFFTEAGIFEEGKLPRGRFPIAHKGFDNVQGHPRGRSVVKQLRPSQIEVNRSNSKMAEHQITLGDDKIVTQAGSKLQQGASLAGVRELKVQGPPPQILEGRTGAQYLPYAEQQKSDLFGISLVEDQAQDNISQVDPYTLLYKAASQRKKFGIYVDKFEDFLKQFWEITLDLAREALSDEELIEAVGHAEAVNIQEFRNPSKLCYILELEAQTDDVETKLGRQLSITQMIQYAGGQLEKEDLGKLFRQLPYANKEGMFDDMTLNYDSATNMILALDRGELPKPNKKDAAEYMVQRLTARTRKADFSLMKPEIQTAYEEYIKNYEELAAKQWEQLQIENEGIIPTGGGLVAMDIYVPDPKNPQSQKRARVPYESVNWLLKRLDAQGMTEERMQTLQPQDQIDIAGMAQNQQPQPIQQQAPQVPGGMTPSETAPPF